MIILICFIYTSSKLNFIYFPESRSNSTGHVFLHSPSDVFGSLISDTEEFLEDFQMNHGGGSMGTNIYSPTSQSPTSPPLSPASQFRLCSAPKKTKALPAPGKSEERGLMKRDQESLPPSEPTVVDKSAVVEFNKKPHHQQQVFK